MSNMLEGIKVIELAGFVAAPSCAKILADMGAEVIKIEVMGGDPWRNVGKVCTRRSDEENPIYDIYNSGKKSICLNIKAPGGYECLMKMLETADVFITNMRQKSLKRAGLDGETLLRKYPKLIHATITGFGSEGPDADSPGFDNIAFWARSGFMRDMSLNSADWYPVLAPTGVGDTITGTALYAAIATALFKRERTGKGDIVSASIYGTAIWSMGSMVIRGEKKYKEEFPKSRWNDSPVNCPYKCGDGDWIAITILEYERYAPTFYEIVGVTEQVKAIDAYDYSKMATKKKEVFAITEEAFLKKSSQEWLKEFRAADIVCCRMNHFADVENDEQAWANGFVQKMEMRNGESMSMPRTPLRFVSYKMGESVVAPMPGENTEEVLLSNGITIEEVQTLKDSGAVK